MTYSEATKIHKILDTAQHVLIIQADNPDGDSLASALAMEQILGDMGKKTSLYCSVDMPQYLRYLSGWDRVNKDIPARFDASVIVDASTMTLFEKLSTMPEKNWVATKPVIVLDHHDTVNESIPFATITINDPYRASAGELIYKIGRQLGWPLSVHALELLMTSILGDTQGLSNNLTSSETYRVMAELVDAGVDRPRLEEARREFSKMPLIIFKYKAMLIERTEAFADNRIVFVDIPQHEINAYSPLYNPIPLIQNDMLQIQGVGVAIAMKIYGDGKLTAAIRCNPGHAIAAELAEHFGGGGHAYASGFKIITGRPFNEVKSECIEFATQLLDKLDSEKPNETIQYAYSTD